MFRFQSWYFLLLILPAYYVVFSKKRSVLKFSSLAIIKKQYKKTYKPLISKIILFLALLLFILALARPQMVQISKHDNKKGIDIVLALDVSRSMLYQDMAPSRISAAKAVMKEFISKRQNDKIGLVIFAGTAYTKTPLTLDYSVVDKMLDATTVDDVKQDGTAIGTGLAVAFNRLKTSDAKSKVVILVTDGANNAGVITPNAAINLAKELHIKVYTIGIGSNNPYYGGGVDKKLLETIAKESSGKYYQADSKGKLDAIFSDIDHLEKSTIKEQKHYITTDYFKPLIQWGLILLALATIIESLIVIIVP